MPKPPIDPEGFDKINFIIDSWVTGCDAPWYIYIETMKPAAMEAFIVLITFGWADVLRGALRPKGLGRRTSKRKGRWNKRIPAFPEVGNTIGKHLPFAEQLEDFVHWGSKTRNLWRIDNAIQAGLFFWLVADVAEDFVFNWTSLLYETHWCREPRLGNFSYSQGGLATKVGNIWWQQAFGIEDYNNGPPSWGFLRGSSGPTGATIVSSATFKPFGSFTPADNCKVRIIDIDDRDAMYIGDSDLKDVNGVIKVVSKANIPPNHQFEVSSWHDGWFMDVGLGVVAGTANP